jgi:hypothetical protein
VKFPEPIQRKFHFRYPVRTTQNKSKEKQTDTDAKISPPPPLLEDNRIKASRCREGKKERTPKCEFKMGKAK